MIDQIPLEALGKTVEIVPNLQPFFDTLQPLLGKISYLLGGIFGLYLIMILVRIYYERKQMKVLKDIRYDLDRLNRHYGLSYSREKKSWFKRLFGSVYRMFRKK